MFGLASLVREGVKGGRRRGRTTLCSEGGKLVDAVIWIMGVILLRCC